MARISVPKQPRPHQLEPTAKSTASLKQQLIRQLACGDTTGAKQTRLLMAESNARGTAVEPRHCHAVMIEDGRVVETVKMTATPEARDYFESASSGTRKI